MEPLKKLKKVFDTELSMIRLLKVAILMVILFLFLLTSNFWGEIWHKLSVILLPFFVGAIIAYIVHPLIGKLAKLKISRNISIPLIILSMFAFLSWVLISLLPLVYNDAINFINTLRDSVLQLYDWYLEMSQEPSEIVKLLSDQVVNYLNDYKSWFPNLTVIVPQIINSFINFFTNAILSIIVAIYVLFDFDNIAATTYKIAGRISGKLPEMIKAVDNEVSDYLRAMFVLMAIRFVEYGLLYYLVGHRYWLIMGLFSSLSLIVPYFGPTLANAIGLLTSLVLPWSSSLILLVFMIILSPVDTYIISPFIHARNNEVKPLWTLFSVFAGGILFGAFGIMIAVPVYMSLRAIFRLMHEEEPQLE
ncbi:MAG: AI-2E family transporter [Erysipelotrichaceae bacterium]|jgi:predicted PurR-regulated permease PerM|nr:AI-2E family transporter [Erysipelotrichaceae bacterium]